MLKKIFKICLHIILVFVILTTLVFLLRELLFVSIKFLIGLRESFIQSTRFGKLYLIMLYSFMFYIVFELSFFANIIRNRKNQIIENYFNDKESGGVNKYKMILMMLCIYISICLIGFLFYALAGGKWNEANAANIINVFIWATYLIAPIVAIWVYSDWREPHKLNKKLDLINEIEGQILSLERCSRELNELINSYLSDPNKPYSKLQIEYNQFTRKMANLEILSRQLEMNIKLEKISKQLSNFNYSFVQFSLFPSGFLSILKKENIHHWEKNSIDNSFEDRISMLLAKDDREEWLSKSYGDIFEIQKELIVLKKEYIF